MMNWGEKLEILIYLKRKLKDESTKSKSLDLDQDSRRNQIEKIR